MARIVKLPSGKPFTEIVRAQRALPQGKPSAELTPQALAALTAIGTNIIGTAVNTGLGISKAVQSKEKTEAELELARAKARRESGESALKMEETQLDIAIKRLGLPGKEVEARIQQEILARQAAAQAGRRETLAEAEDARSRAQTLIEVAEAAREAGASEAEVERMILEAMPADMPVGSVPDAQLAEPGLLAEPGMQVPRGGGPLSRQITSGRPELPAGSSRALQEMRDVAARIAGPQVTPLAAPSVSPGQLSVAAQGIEVPTVDRMAAGIAARDAAAAAQQAQVKALEVRATPSPIEQLAQAEIVKPILEAEKLAANVISAQGTAVERAFAADVLSAMQASPGFDITQHAESKQKELLAAGVRAAKLAEDLRISRAKAAQAEEEGGLKVRITDPQADPANYIGQGPPDKDGDPTNLPMPTIEVTPETARTIAIAKKLAAETAFMEIHGITPELFYQNARFDAAERRRRAEAAERRRREDERRRREDEEREEKKREKKQKKQSEAEKEVRRRLEKARADEAQAQADYQKAANEKAARERNATRTPESDTKLDAAMRTAKEAEARASARRKAAQRELDALKPTTEDGGLGGKDGLRKVWE